MLNLYAVKVWHNREPRHFDAVQSICSGMTAVRRRSARYEAHLGELGGIRELFGETQVAVMNGIERAAENADRAGH